MAIRVNDDPRLAGSDILLLQEDSGVGVFGVHQRRQLPSGGQLPMFIIEILELFRKAGAKLGHAFREVIVVNTRELHERGMKGAQIAYLLLEVGTAIARLKRPPSGVLELSEPPPGPDWSLMVIAVPTRSSAKTTPTAINILWMRFIRSLRS
jgi:hypothetical protein